MSLRFKTQNGWLLKLRRSLFAVLPVAQNREGECCRCGACCRLPRKCPFLKFGGDSRSLCRIYRFRPLNCRKYPRTESEFATRDSCGFKFKRKDF